ncbi:hypothetical protein [Alloalcanivorax profundimaris]|jgi:lauroyl/myristoyl acyltransferase|uniref:Uncharacterized protein n=1 Tax=Alloalcanivorax profundimaris TaxID=2735259 RepID=A0ABS0AT08_9GAMM|nr:hypothetical protein [Alloalcanivorax profundimaris]MAO59994.1 hypothetical protein [Alcanivorax sp.]MBM1145367.1 hypothetical protein [Alcanivorax sp. ZXX171]MCQ6263067.1 hypothetical protein [Alcanivorax sp. MM125-6]QJX01684.1 hypothetical protein HML84_03225 [Alcanivorax sp. IO_7]MAY09286.1 hypothetical protein [Alcanivorax sp.]|tara:strand:+ start:350 stop:529 length:180 start_codon:yes stop_codon:yes gene_type:complete
MQRSKWIWLIWAVVVLCYLVPYTVLSDVHAWYGSFLFWTLAGVAVIAINFIITKDFEGH